MFCDRMVEISVRLNKEAAEIASDVLNELDQLKANYLTKSFKSDRFSSKLFFCGKVL